MKLNVGGKNIARYASPEARIWNSLVIKLNVEGIGQVTVGSLQDPADAVEAFALAAASAGVPFGFDQMKELMDYFEQGRTEKRRQNKRGEGKGNRRR